MYYSTVGVEDFGYVEPCMGSLRILNDTCLVTNLRDVPNDTFRFHKFDYKPDSTFALQWIP